ncbi:MAG TPA: NAD-dependent dihydropyrimidine dehydrogenase subunit PreA, partial [bacterium]|nr:NAD-dependent dihydropyrimidine dehydrogenase subunit PreA [bacterium]
MTRTPDLSVEFLGVTCENPFFLSSSPVSNTADQCARAFEAGWGGAVFKTMNLEEKFRVVMPSPRLAAYHCGARRFVGLQNAEQISDRPVKDNIKDIARLKKLFPKKALCASILGYEEEDWQLLARMAEDAGCDFLELNFSCPQ